MENACDFISFVLCFCLLFLEMITAIMPYNCAFNEKSLNLNKNKINCISLNLNICSLFLCLNLYPKIKRLLFLRFVPNISIRSHYDNTVN